MKNPIGWCDETLNVTVGCTHAGTPGCDNCYARKLHTMRHKAFLDGKKVAPQYSKPFDELQVFIERLEDLTWRGRERRVFIDSMSDLFHADVPDDTLDDVFSILLARDILDTSHHTFILLTKRAERMAEYLTRRSPQEMVRTLAAKGNHHVRLDNPDVFFSEQVEGLCNCLWDSNGLATSEWKPGYSHPENVWPLKHVHLGVTVENQAAAELRLPWLRKLKAAGWPVCWVSYEPALGAVDWKPWADCIDWLVAGGENGGFNIIGGWPRLVHPDWIRASRDFCQQHGKAFFFKGWGWSSYGYERLDPKRHYEHAKLILPDGQTFSYSGDAHSAAVLGPKDIGWREITTPPTDAYFVNYQGRAGCEKLDGREWNELPEAARK